MTQWRKKIQLKDLLTEDETDSEVRRVASEMARRLKKQSEYENDYQITTIVSEFEDIAHADSVGDDVFGGRFSLCDWFNKVLNDLYDWADDERVWIE